MHQCQTMPTFASKFANDEKHYRRMCVIMIVYYRSCSH